MNGLGVSSDRAYLLPADAAAVLGLDRSRTPFEVWLEKKGREVLVGGAPVFARVLEPLIADFYERDHNCDLTDASSKIFVHAKHPFLAAHPAWLVEGQRTGLDILSVPGSVEEGWGKYGERDVSERWRLRAIVSMAVLDYDRWDLAVSVDNEYPLYYSLERNLQNEETVIQSLQRWWDTYVVGDCEPNPGSSHLATHYLQARFPAVLVPAQDADPVLEKVGAELSAVLAHIAAFEQRRVSLENLIKLKMGAAEAVIGEFGKVSWRKAGPVTSVNWQKLAEALLSAHYAGRERELVAAFSGITNGNREFRFVPRGKKEFAH